MSQSETPQVDVQQFTFDKQALEAVDSNRHASDNWPIVYILSDESTRTAYVGETTNAKSRLRTHLRDKKKKKLTSAVLVSSAKFNKSATLDIEASLIRYLAADGKFRPINSNLGGAIDHNYYQKDGLYQDILRETWNNLRHIGLAQRSLESIDNSDVFKYSPYKTLSADQRESLIGIFTALLDARVETLLIEGGAGTGKSVLAIFLFKLLHSDIDDIQLREFSDDELVLRVLITRFKKRFPDPRMALVVPMSSFRSTLRRAFGQIAGLSAKMVIGPAELTRQHYDVVLVDEAHRLRQRKNLGSYFGRFDAVCKELSMDACTASEVDWVLAQSTKSVFFYDQNQSIKPSDADAAVFDRLETQRTTQQQVLLSQFRVNAGNSYSQFISDLLHVTMGDSEVFSSKQYELKVFDRIDDLIATIEERNEKLGLSRLVAGFAWPWVSKKNLSCLTSRSKTRHCNGTAPTMTGSTPITPSRK
ncbi:DNA/RNA helicase domain-containing protein [Spiribacter sp. 227]|uniref:DNA/RNA helicase domain-containing protein n=1 Tax=Spiribacter onubensis TaxID=3122420 RepID=A0ABV3S8H4_9GAMM